MLRATTRARPAKRVAPTSTNITTRTQPGRWKTGHGAEPHSRARIWFFDTMPPRSSVRTATSAATISLPDAIVNWRADLLSGEHGTVVVVARAPPPWATSGGHPAAARSPSRMGRVRTSTPSPFDRVIPRRSGSPVSARLGGTKTSSAQRNGVAASVPPGGGGGGAPRWRNSRNDAASRWPSADLSLVGLLSVVGSTGAMVPSARRTQPPAGRARVPVEIVSSRSPASTPQPVGMKTAARVSPISRAFRRKPNRKRLSAHAFPPTPGAR